ncbi:helix-turn-helix domain-containing protein [Zobellia laminariae]|uniref:helix-turn-helix domain-containing protein n=1 Tax=Zobellia laminariae TaxID=248906 RepID=UPI0012D8AC3E|nr:AraC family transcriptional regulator [Zobellia laminariae]
MGIEPNKFTSKRIEVPETFQDIFTHFYRAENRSENPITKTLVPSFQIIMVYSFGAPIQFKTEHDTQMTIEKCLVLGPIKKAFDYTLPAGSDMLVANFKDDAFYRFFGKVILSDYLPTNPDSLLTENCFTNLWQLIKNVTPKERVNLILDFCKPYLKESETAFQKLADYTDDYTVFNPIKIIAQETEQSERTIQLNHKKYFGYTAKEKSRYEKFIKAIGLLQNQSSKVNWFAIIEACGYYDQSQLIHDFKYFTGHTPTQYLKFSQDICQTE